MYSPPKKKNTLSGQNATHFICVCLFEVTVCSWLWTHTHNSCAAVLHLLLVIWHRIKAGERDALQVLNWISCRISGTSLKCMWASPNDALIFALQRLQSAHMSVCVGVCLCLGVFFHQLAQAHNRYICIISGSNCFVGFCWQTPSGSVHVMTGRGFYSASRQQAVCLWPVLNVCF